MIHIGDRFYPKEGRSWDYVTVVDKKPSTKISGNLHIFYTFEYRDKSWGSPMWDVPVAHFDRMAKNWEPTKETLLRRYIKAMHE